MIVNRKLLVAVVPPMSATRTLNLNTPDSVGVPLSSPEPSSCNPPGRSPESSAQLYGPVEPLAVNALLNAAPSVPADNGDVVVIEMNPRVSRSSALASKATGFPIAKIAARLAVGYTLDEILNDITGATPACFEPTIDYVVTKIPRFAFEKFRGSPAVLTTAMKSVGEAMAIGRCFEESFQKAMRSLETGHAGWGCDRPDPSPERGDLDRELRTPAPDRILAVRTAMVNGYSDAEIHRLSAIDPWFLAKLRLIVEAEQRLLRGRSLAELDAEESTSIGETRAALADQALGLLSLYALASTPIQSVGYDPATGQVLVKLRIGEGTSLNLGSQWGGAQGIGIRRRLSQRWSIRTELNPPIGAESRGSVFSAVLEWGYRY